MENKTTVNPNPFPTDRQWQIDPKICTVCGECVDACKRTLLSIKNRTIVMSDINQCNECGDCVAVCGYRAISFV